MAVTYPLDLVALKRSIDLAEQMNTDLDMSDLTIEQRLVSLKDAIVVAQNTYNSGIETNKDEFNALVDSLATVGNDLKDKIDALDLASGGNLDALSEQIVALKTLLEGDAGVTIINTLDVIADEINSRKATVVFSASITDATGEASVDIASLGLTSVDDFDVSISQNATTNFAFVQSAVKKVDKNTIKIVAFDSKYTPETSKPYDGTNAPVTFMVSVHYYKPSISVAITETDGDTATVGN